MFSKFLTLILTLIASFNVFALESGKRKKLKLSNKMTKEQVALTLEKAGFPKKVVPIVTCLAKYESDFNPHAVNHDNVNTTKDHGLLQINDIWKKECNVSEEGLKDPVKNAKCALKVYNQQGLTAWVTYKKFKNICLAYEIPNYNSTNIAETIVKSSVTM